MSNNVFMYKSATPMKLIKDYMPGSKKLTTQSSLQSPPWFPLQGAEGVFTLDHRYRLAFCHPGPGQLHDA